MITQKRILKSALSFLQYHEGYDYERGLKKVSNIIQTGEHANNPVFASLIEAGLPSSISELHDIMKPGPIIHE